MEVNIIGGGPSGSYLALLLKQSFPEWDLNVYEQYPPATTYGWGIVLPEKIYPVLQEADAPSADDIESSVTRWDPIETWYRGERIECSGFPYTSILRSTLLEILQDRCEDVGVEMHFETEADPRELRRSSDLLVGADGLGSGTREEFSEAFGPEVEAGRNKYAWFGTDKSFDALTHVYVDTADGVWHAAAYPGPTSTFAVSCAPETWQNAGMDERTGASAKAYLEDAFNDALDGHELLSKENKWRNFLTVENETWHHDNVVLIGDSAHTAHFTIGSGTRMAIDDAIALRDALESTPEDLEGALRSYERDRRPHIDALQGAAELSQMHFEHIERYADMAPVQLAFVYLTRTGYNTYESIRREDPTFIRAVNRWFASSRGIPAGANSVQEPALQPFDLEGVTLQNRAVAAPGPRDAAVDGNPIDDQMNRLVSRANTGVGAVLAPRVAVSADGRITPGTWGLYEDSHVDQWSAAIDRIHELTAAKVGVELLHAGRRGATQPQTRVTDRPLAVRNSWSLLAPSPIPYADYSQVPDAMDANDMDRVRTDYVAAAKRAVDAGADFLQLHAGHGYLLASFLSPLTNHRGDGYGGDLQNRMRYPLEVVEAIQAACPATPLSVTLPATDWASDGYDVQDAFTVAETLGGRGVDLVSVVAGQTVPEQDPEYDAGTFRLYTHWIRNKVGIPTLSTAHNLTLDEVNTVVAGGRADLCTVARPERLDLETQ